jgi:hypothetical protein
LSNPKSSEGIYEVNVKTKLQKMCHGLIAVGDNMEMLNEYLQWRRRKIQQTAKISRQETKRNLRQRKRQTTCKEINDQMIDC